MRYAALIIGQLIGKNVLKWRNGGAIIWISCVKVEKLFQSNQGKLDISLNRFQIVFVDTSERKQIRLILEKSFDDAKRSLVDSIKTLQAKASAEGTLNSGNTLKRYAAVFEQEGEKFLSCAVDGISAVTMDMEAFQMFSEQLEQFGNEIRRNFEDDRIILHITKSRNTSAGKAFWDLFSEATARLKLQKDIRAFTFTKPAHSQPAEIKKTAAQEISPAKRKQGGRPPAEW